MADTSRKPWLCRRCGKVLAMIEGGELDPQMPPTQQVTDFPDRRVFLCECGFVQVWRKAVAQSVDIASNT